MGIIRWPINFQYDREYLNKGVTFRKADGGGLEALMEALTKKNI